MTPTTTAWSTPRALAAACSMPAGSRRRPGKYSCWRSPRISPVAIRTPPSQPFRAGGVALGYTARGAAGVRPDGPGRGGSGPCGHPYRLRHGLHAPRVVVAGGVDAHADGVGRHLVGPVGPQQGL